MFICTWSTLLSKVTYTYNTKKCYIQKKFGKRVFYACYLCFLLLKILLLLYSDDEKASTEKASDEAHRTFMDTYQQIFIRAPKPLPRIPWHGDNKP